MPATAPPLDQAVAIKLAALGEHIRDHRRRLGITAVTTAEAAGMSRVTLHRIERGEPSVTMGAYIGAASALGLELGLVATGHKPAVRARRKSSLPARILLADYPQLARLAWQLHGVTYLSPKEALGLYERNWRHLDTGALELGERSLVNALVSELGGGRLLV